MCNFNSSIYTSYMFKEAEILNRSDSFKVFIFKCHFGGSVSKTISQTAYIYTYKMKSK